MSKEVHEGPNSVRLFLDGDLVGMAWHCPENGCREYLDERKEQCPHRGKDEEDGRWVCGDMLRAKDTMRLWAAPEFAKFVRLFGVGERA